MDIDKKEKDFKEEMRLIETIRELFFMDFNKKNISDFMKTLNELKRVLRRYQTLVCEIDERERIIAMKEFSKFRHLEEIDKIN